MCSRKRKAETLCLQEYPSESIERQRGGVENDAGRAQPGEIQEKIASRGDEDAVSEQQRDSSESEHDYYLVN